MNSPFRRDNTTSPFFRAAAVTTSDTATIDRTDALLIGTTGDVAVVMGDGNAVTLKAVPVGVLHVAVTQVKTTGTTASNITALYRQVP